MYTLVRVYVCGYVCVCGRTVDTSVDACASMYVCITVNIHAGLPGVTRHKLVKGIHHSTLITGGGRRRCLFLVVFFSTVITVTPQCGLLSERVKRIVVICM